MSTDDTNPTGDEQVEPAPSDEATTSLAGSPPPAAEAHPYRERYLFPVAFPLLIVVGVVFYVLNISRIFLATKGTGAVVIAASVTVLILFGATVLSYASKLRSSSIGLIVVLALVVVTAGGFVTLGHSEVKKVAKVVLGKPVGSVDITAEQALKFTPDKVQVPFDPSGPYSVIQINYHDSPPGGSHTFNFDDSTVVWSQLDVSNAGEVKSESAGFPKAGDYVFYCAIPGHRTAGMQGTITVTASVKPGAASGGGSSSSSSGTTTTTAK